MKKSTIMLAVVSLTGTMLTSASLKAAPYLSAQIGAGHGYPLKFDNDSDNKKKFGWSGRVGLGHLWDVSDSFKFGGEIGAQGYQKIKRSYNFTNTSTRRWSIDALAVADLFLTDNVDIFGKLGAAYVHTKYHSSLSQSNENFLGLSSERKAYYVPKAAVGLGFNVSENANFNISLNHEVRKNSEKRAATSVLAGFKVDFS